MMLPSLPFYAKELGGSVQDISVLVAVFGVSSLIFSPLWGRLSDHFGRKGVFLSSMVISACAMLLAAASNLIGLFVARALAGAAGGNVAVAEAFVGDITEAKERARGMGIISTAMALGFVLGPAIGGILLGAHPDMARLRVPFLSAAAIQLLAVALGWKVLREPSAKERIDKKIDVAKSYTIKPAETNKHLSLTLVVIGLISFHVAANLALFPLWAERRLLWSPMDCGIAFACIGIVLALTQGLAVGRLSSRFALPDLVLGATVIVVAAFAVLAFAYNSVVAGCGLLLFGLGFGLASPVLSATISLRTDGDEQGLVMGMSESVKRIGDIFGPVGLGMVLTHLGEESFYYVQVITVAMAVVVAARLRRVAPN